MSSRSAAIEEQLIALEQDIKSSKYGAESLLQLLDKVQQNVKLQLESLPTHDRESYDTRLQQARSQIWQLKKARRFQFSRGAPAQRQSTTEGSETSADGRTTDILEARNSQVPEFPATKAEQLAKKPEVREYVSVFEPRTVPNLNVANIAMSVVVAADITGALHLTNAANSKIFAKCSQCRIHDSQNIDVYLNDCLNPVIENSTNVRFHTASSDLRVTDFSWRRRDDQSNFCIEELENARDLACFTAEDANALVDGMRHDGVAS